MTNHSQELYTRYYQHSVERVVHMHYLHCRDFFTVLYNAVGGKDLSPTDFVDKCAEAMNAHYVYVRHTLDNAEAKAKREHEAKNETAKGSSITEA